MEYVCRFKIPKEAEPQCNRLATTVTANAPITVHHGVKTVATQTIPVDFCLVEYAFSQLPAEYHLSLLSKLFSAYLSQFSVTIPNNFLSNAASAMLQLSDGVYFTILPRVLALCGLTIAALFVLVKYLAQFFTTENLQQVNHW